MKTQIINPIYDVAFKYLMEDFETASYMFSLLMQCEVTVLSFLPTEYQQLRKEQGLDNKPIFASSRLDFIAEIKLGEKSMKVVLELQKSNYFSSIARFSNYLGQQYSKRDAESLIENVNTENPNNYPIIAVYLLGKNLKRIEETFVRVERKIKSIESGNNINYQYDETFIEMLSHDMIIVQLNRLSQKPKKERKNKIKKVIKETKESLENVNIHGIGITEEQCAKLRMFFSLFDQTQINEIKSTLWIETDELDKPTQQAVNRLNIALTDEKIQWQIQQQKNTDDYFEMLELQRIEFEENKAKMVILESENQFAKRLAEEERRQKEDERKQKEEERKQKEEALHQKEEEKKKNIEMIKGIILLNMDLQPTLTLTQLTEEELLNFKITYQLTN